MKERVQILREGSRIIIYFIDDEIVSYCDATRFSVSCVASPKHNWKRNFVIV